MAVVAAMAVAVVIVRGRADGGADDGSYRGAGGDAVAGRVAAADRRKQERGGE